MRASVCVRHLQAFATGLMEYGMMAGTKALPSAPAPAPTEAAKVPATTGAPRA